MGWGSSGLPVELTWEGKQRGKLHHGGIIPQCAWYLPACSFKGVQGRPPTFSLDRAWSVSCDPPLRTLLIFHRRKKAPANPWESGIRGTRARSRCRENRGRVTAPRAKVRNPAAPYDLSCAALQRTKADLHISTSAAIDSFQAVSPSTAP